MNGLHTLTRAQRERITTLPVSRLDPHERYARRMWDDMDAEPRGGVTVVGYRAMQGGVRYRVLDGECDRERAFFDPPRELGRVYCRLLRGCRVWYSSLDYPSRPYDGARRALDAVLGELGVEP